MAPSKSNRTEVPFSPLDVMEKQKARLLEEAAAIDRDIAELNRLAAKYNLVVSAPSSDPMPPATAPVEPQVKNETPSLYGSIAGLAVRYKADGRSPYHRLRFKTREHYDGLIRRIVKECGELKLADLKMRNIQDAYDGWASNGKTSMAHGLITMLRGLINFGAGTLEDAECERLSVVLHNMYFPMSKSRNERPISERLTLDHANAIRAKAHQMGRPSIALAQAFQFALKLGQKDAIGEWVPVSEPGSSKLIHEGNKWLHGLCWDHIDPNCILRKTPSNGGKEIEVDLRPITMVMEELALFKGELPRSGPVIICEATKVPWTAYEFRRQWRKLADACGIPRNVKNMDSFAGNKKGILPAHRASNGASHGGPRARPPEHIDETEKSRTLDDPLH